MPTMSNIVLNDGVTDHSFTAIQDGNAPEWIDLTAATPAGRASVNCSFSLAGKGNSRVTDKSAVKTTLPREAEVDGVTVVVATDIGSTNFVFGPGNTAATREDLINVHIAALQDTLISAIIEDLVPAT